MRAKEEDSGKLTECTLNLARGDRIRDYLRFISLQRDSFTPKSPVVSENKFEQRFLYPKASEFLKILKCYDCS